LNKTLNSITSFQPFWPRTTLLASIKTRHRRPFSTTALIVADKSEADFDFNLPNPLINSLYAKTRLLLDFDVLQVNAMTSSDWYQVSDYYHNYPSPTTIFINEPRRLNS
jgi:hypothetical protein